MSRKAKPSPEDIARAALERAKGKAKSRVPQLNEDAVAYLGVLFESFKSTPRCARVTQQEALKEIKENFGFAGGRDAMMEGVREHFGRRSWQSE